MKVYLRNREGLVFDEGEFDTIEDALSWAYGRNGRYSVELPQGEVLAVTGAHGNMGVSKGMPLLREMKEQIFWTGSKEAWIEAAKQNIQ